jgi:putative N6-adenine-specific DNA methylase
MSEKARERVLSPAAGPSIMALDIDPRAVVLARKLSEKAGAHLRVEQLDVREFMGTEPPGQVLTNPPYGVRLARGEDFERGVAGSFRALKGHRISAICLDLALSDAMAIKPVQEHALWNGDLECRLFTWEP